MFSSTLDLGAGFEPASSEPESEVLPVRRPENKKFFLSKNTCRKTKCDYSKDCKLLVI